MYGVLRQPRHADDERRGLKLVLRGVREQVGPYELICHLGRGGTANVFEARHVKLGTRVALKVLHSIAGGSHGATQLALSEGRALSAIHHPHVVRTVDGGTHHGVPYVVMELLEGEDLARRLAFRGPQPARQTVDLFLPVISGLAAAHAAGLVHRDLKPSNIFLARRKLGVEPVVVDFGLAKFADAAGGPAASGIIGTPQYMAPEQVRGMHATPGSDQWSLGAVFYECVTGGSPFWGHDRYELIHSVMTAPIVPPSEINPEIPRALDAIVLRALARSPEGRFPSMRALGAALLPFASTQARRRWNDEFAEGSRSARPPNPAPALSAFGWNGARSGAPAPRSARQSNARGGFEIRWIGRVVYVKLGGVWDVAMATAFCSGVLGIARRLAGRPWAILADSREFPAQSPDVARLRQEAMIKIRRLGCEKIASVSSNAAHAMQFSRITLESRVGSGVFRDERSALNWIHDRRGQGSETPPLRAPPAVDPTGPIAKLVAKGER